MIGPDAMILVFCMLSFKPVFSLSSRGSLVLLHFLLLDPITLIAASIVSLAFLGFAGIVENLLA